MGNRKVSDVQRGRCPPRQAADYPQSGQRGCFFLWAIFLDELPPLRATDAAPVGAESENNRPQGCLRGSETSPREELPAPVRAEVGGRRVRQEIQQRGPPTPFSRQTSRIKVLRHAARRVGPVPLACVSQLETPFLTPKSRRCRGGPGLISRGLAIPGTREPTRHSGRPQKAPGHTATTSRPCGGDRGTGGVGARPRGPAQRGGARAA